MTPKQFFYIILSVIVVSLVAGGVGYVYAFGRLETAKVTYTTAEGQQAADQDQIDALANLKKNTTYLLYPINR